MNTVNGRKNPCVILSAVDFYTVNFAVLALATYASE